MSAKLSSGLPTFRSVVDDAKQVHEQSDTIEDWQRQQPRFQRVSRFQDELVDEIKQEDTHSSRKNRWDEPWANNCS